MGSTSQSDNEAFTEPEIAKFSNQVTKQKYVKFDHARALQLRIRDKLTYDEIAERLNTTPRSRPHVTQEVPQVPRRPR